MARVGKDCVESTLQHLLLKRFTVALRNADVNVGIGDDELFGNKWHPERGDGGIAPNIQRADELIGAVTHDLLYVRRATHEFARIGEESAARGRQPYAVGPGAHHELLANGAFKFIERLRHCGLGDVNLLGSGGDRSGICSGNEVLQLTQSEAKRIHKNHTYWLRISTIL